VRAWLCRKLHLVEILYERDDSSFQKPGQSAMKVFKVLVSQEKQPGFWGCCCFVLGCASKDSHPGASAGLCQTLAI